MKSFILLFFSVIVFLVRGECQTCENHMQVIIHDQICYGDHKGSIYVLPPDTGYCALCDDAGFYFSKFVILDSSGEEVQGNDFLAAGTYTLIAVMSCNSRLNGDVLTIDSVNESITITQPPFPAPVFTKIIDTSQSCAGGEIQGYTGLASYILGTPCAILNFQSHINGVISAPLALTLGDSGYFDQKGLTAGEYRYMSGTYWVNKVDTTPWILMDVCGTPSSGFGTKAVTSTSAIVLWDPWPCAEHFKVRYKKQNESGWKTTSVINAFSFGAAKLKGLEPGTTYKWQVQSLCSYDPDIASTFSAIQTFTTLKSQEKDEDAAAANYSLDKLTIFPNPASSRITIDASGLDGNANVFLYNTFGELVLSTDWNTAERTQNIDVSKLSRGMYEVIIRNESYSASGTFIKE